MLDSEKEKDLKQRNRHFGNLYRWATPQLDSLLAPQTFPTLAHKYFRLQALEYLEQAV